MRLRLGETVPIKGRNVTVTQAAFEHLPAIRGHLIDVAKANQTIPYGQVVADLQLPWLPRGLGRVLDLLSEDCHRRGEPSLAALVVTDGTGEVGSDFAGDPQAERARVYRYWAAQER